MDLTINGLRIDPAIFTFKFTCMCNGECCNYGVYTDKKEYEILWELRDEIKQFMDDSQPTDSSAWFEPEEADDDFPSGIAVGTEVFNGKCVFLDKEGLCSIQKMSMTKGEYKWKYKPLYCILFPLTIYDGALTIDYEHTDRLHHCNKNVPHTTTIFEYCNEELKHLLGAEGFETLEKMRNQYLADKE
ncbi:MAG: DUF3109 family protein [Ignavibacteria bacterium]|nr:DUF3109 family protein [Ignavibacteria bacterium]